MRRRRPTGQRRWRPSPCRPTALTPWSPMADPVVLLSEEEVAARVAALAAEIAPKIDDDTVAVCLLTGGLW
ncbi:MAG: hypothetical protein V4656_04055, partial [Pseudomonadota bacterium]